MSAKSVVGVIIVAILIGVIYVVFEKNFTGTSSLTKSPATTSKEVPKDSMGTQTQQESSLIKYPEPNSAGSEINESTDLLPAAEGLQMRDYSGMFEELKDTL